VYSPKHHQQSEKKNEKVMNKETRVGEQVKKIKKVVTFLIFVITTG